MHKTYQYTGSQSDLPAILADITENVIEIRFSKWMDENKNIIGDRIDITVGDEENPIIYGVPFKVPIITAEQFVEAAEYYVLSPKPQETPEAALSKAVEISGMSKKGLAEIVLNLVKVVEAQDVEIKALKEKVK